MRDSELNSYNFAGVNLSSNLIGSSEIKMYIFPSEIFLSMNLKRARKINFHKLNIILYTSNTGLHTIC